MELTEKERRVLFDAIEKTDRCWLWKGGFTNKGFPRITFNGVQHSPHRLLWEIENGAIPERHTLGRTCENPRCIRPNHHMMERMGQARIRKNRENTPDQTVAPKGASSTMESLPPDELIQRLVQELSEASELIQQQTAEIAHLKNRIARQEELERTSIRPETLKAANDVLRSFSSGRFGS